MMLAGVYVTPVWTSELSRMVRAAGADALADRLHQEILTDAAHELALTIDEEAIILGALEDPPPTPLAELRAVLTNDHLWRPTLIARANAKTVHEAIDAVLTDGTPSMLQADHRSFDEAHSLAVRLLTERGAHAKVRIYRNRRGALLHIEPERD
jgi:hypothetical protein